MDLNLITIQGLKSGLFLCLTRTKRSFRVLVSHLFEFFRSSHLPSGIDIATRRVEKKAIVAGTSEAVGNSLDGLSSHFKEGDIGGGGVPNTAITEEKMANTKYRVENRLNTDTVYFNRN